MQQEHVHKTGLTLGQRWADNLARGAGSWTFILLFLLFIFAWMLINAYLILVKPWDPYPFILLNLVLSCLAAIQAPVILMSQNRHAERDRQRGERDYYIDRKAEKEIKVLQHDILEIKGIVSKQPQKQTAILKQEIEKLEKEIEHLEKQLTV